MIVNGMQPPVGNDLADGARGVPAKPPVGQTPPVGSGAHSVPSQPFAECAPGLLQHAKTARTAIPACQPRASREPRCEEPVTEFASAAFPPAAGNEAPVPTLASEVTGASEFSHRGETILDIDEIVNRVLAANRVIERISERCPQGDDCAGDPGTPGRTFDCEEGCGFRGCVACLMVHEAEPHWSDSDTAREMYQGNREIR